MCRWSPLPRGFGRLEDAVGEINVKLAALIAHLDQTGEVEAAVEGRVRGHRRPTGRCGLIRSRRS